MSKYWLRRTLAVAAACTAIWALAPSAAPTAYAFGEAGPLRLAQFGNFVINAQITADGGITDQMYVDFMIPEDQRYPYPVVLVHGGGGQSTDWRSTVDGRDGWVNYLLNAGFALYIVDRPGAGRSVSNTTYGNGLLAGPNVPTGIARLATTTHWPGAPMIYRADGTPDLEGWQASALHHPSTVAWAATSPRTPFASNEVSIAAQTALLERIGPAVIFTHANGGATAMGAAIEAAAGGNVIGILAFEAAGAHVYEDEPLARGEWSRGAPTEDRLSDQPIAAGGLCALQTATEKSELVTLADVPMAFLYSDRMTDADSLNVIACAAEQAREAGIEAIGIHMPDHPGGEGTGHFAMSEIGNGELAENIVIPLLAWLQGEDLPAGFTTR
jgi:pimeloyl-ACP methyl ester carboxylesterase